jgi:hypothetical protein
MILDTYMYVIGLAIYFSYDTVQGLYSLLLSL